jgi:hypothetical protein
MQQKSWRGIASQHARPAMRPQPMLSRISRILQCDIERILNIRLIPILPNARRNADRRTKQRQCLIHQVRSKIHQQPIRRIRSLFPRILAGQRPEPVKVRFIRDQPPNRLLG